MPNSTASSLRNNKTKTQTSVMAERITIIDFVEKYSRKYENHPYLREKIEGK